METDFKINGVDVNREEFTEFQEYLRTFGIETTPAAAEQNIRGDELQQLLDFNHDGKLTIRDFNHFPSGNQYIDFTDFAVGQYDELTNDLQAGGNLFLVSCKNGAGEKSADNL